MLFCDQAGLISTSVFFMALISWIIPFKRLSAKFSVAVIAVLLGSLSASLGSVSAAAVIRGGVGDLSIPGLYILCLYALERIIGFSPAARKEVDWICALIGPVALIFYPLALGLGSYDPYGLGYGSPYLLALLLALSLYALIRGSYRVVILLSLSVLCYAAGWYESNNLWDYILDPIFGLYAIGIAIQKCFRSWALKMPDSSELSIKTEGHSFPNALRNRQGDA